MAEKFEPMNAKGVRDFLPEEAIPRKRIIERLKAIFEKYGYSPLETPAIERIDVLSAKFAGGAEIMKEIFKVEDQGGRELALRYDLTVPMAKVVGMNPNLPKPFKRYQIQPVWRDGPVKLGRYREFMQCDADVVGTKSMLADAEILAIISEFFTKLGLGFVIRVSSRKLMNGILGYAGIKENKMDAILSIDKLEKFGIDAFRKEMDEKGFGAKMIENVLKILELKGRNGELLEKAEKLMKDAEVKEGIKELKELLEYCELMGVAIKLDFSLARGLEYYTGPVFEVYLEKSKVTSSVAGGGRYDRMIGMFIGRGDYPATGISFGLEPIFEALKERKNEAQKTVTQALVIPIGTLKEAIKLADKLRKDGIRTEIDLLERGISANLNYANSLGIPYVVFLGKKELAEKKVKLRDMRSGKEKMLEVSKVKSEIITHQAIGDINAF
jgi:histidyl-tRNA synthetase